MGPDDGEVQDGIPYWYYFMFPFLCCIRLAQPCLSILKFWLNYIFGTNFEVGFSYWCYWKFLSFILDVIFELSCWFKWLIWIFSYFSGYFLVRLLVLPSAIFYSVFGYSNFYNKKGNEPSTRQSRRKFTHKFEAYDKRLMLLSAYMLQIYV